MTDQTSASASPSGNRLAGKVAIITGGVSGMGLGTVRLFVAEGARVVIGDVQDEPGQRLVAALGDAVRYQHCDVAKEADVAALVARAVDEFGALDCIFNNAGFGGVAGEITDIDVGNAYRNTVDVLFTGVLLGMKHAGAVMKKQRRGSIVSTASVAGLRGGWGPHVYSAMKAAVVNLTRSVALELGEYNVRVNAICPGFIATPIFAGARNMNYDARMRFAAELEQYVPPNSPIPRVGTGRDIGQMALFLASDDSTFVTGQAFAVDGGITAGNKRTPCGPSAIQQLAERVEQDAS